MANVNIKFNNKDYILSCEDDQEDNLKELAKHLDSKYEELKKKLGNIGENKLLLITSIKIVDEYFEIQKLRPYNESTVLYRRCIKIVYIYVILSLGSPYARL